MAQGMETGRIAQTGPEGQGLAKGSLRTIDAVAISISVLSPAMAMQLNTGGVAGTAGGATPLAFLLGGIACLALALVVIGFSRRVAAPGHAPPQLSPRLRPDLGLPPGLGHLF